MPLEAQDIVSSQEKLINRVKQNASPSSCIRERQAAKQAFAYKPVERRITQDKANHINILARPKKPVKRKIKAIQLKPC